MNAKDIDISVPGQRTQGTLYYPVMSKGKAPGLLFIHGWKSNKEEFADAARELCKLGLISFAFNMRGHDECSQQIHTVSRIDNLEDVLVAYDLLASREEIDKSRIGVVGVSYGGYLAAILSAKRDIKWLVLRAPALYEDTDFDKPKEEVNKVQNLKEYRREKLDPEDNEVLAHISGFRGDVLIVESENDIIIPHQEIVNYLEASDHADSVTHRTIPHADHELSQEEWRGEFVSILTNWFTERLE